ncbi:baseplate assembly protein, partial [Escherichia sp. HC-CC]
CMLSHSVSTDLDNLAGNLNTERLVRIPATETTDAEMESDTALRLRAQSAFEGLVALASATLPLALFAKYSYAPVGPATLSP